MTEEMSRQVAELVAREQIRDLASNYCHGIDKRDADLVLAVFADDAEWMLADDFVPTGHAEIEKALVAAIWPAHRSTHHWTANHVITFAGAIATGLCDVDSTVQTAEGEWKRAAATYRDTYVQRGGRWLIQRREAELSFLEVLS